MIQQPLTQMITAWTQVPLGDPVNTPTPVTYSFASRVNMKDALMPAASREIQSVAGYVQPEFGITEFQTTGNATDNESGLDRKTWSAAAICKARGDANTRFLYRIDLNANMEIYGLRPRVYFGYGFTKPDGTGYARDRLIGYRTLPLKRNCIAGGISDTLTDDDTGTNFDHESLSGSWLVRDAGGPPTPPSASVVGKAGYTVPSHVAAIFVLQRRDILQMKPGSSSYASSFNHRTMYAIKGWGEISIERIHPDNGTVYRRI